MYRRILLLSGITVIACSAVIGCGNTTPSKSISEQSNESVANSSQPSTESNSTKQGSSQQSNSMPMLSSLIKIPTKSYSIRVSAKSMHKGDYPFKIRRQSLSNVNLSADSGQFKNGSSKNSITNFDFIKTISTDNLKESWLLFGNNNSLVVHFTTWATKSMHSKNTMNVGVQVPSNFMSVKVEGPSNQQISVNTNSIYPYYQFKVHSNTWYNITYGYGNSTSTVRVKFSYK